MQKMLLCHYHKLIIILLLIKLHKTIGDAIVIDIVFD